ncbi:MAG: SUMF1/EgtB/PvdO family nonheme iron enzyme [Planctomycetes bacterium]|nr:SUMF1/EgtB/PvdO family nonheme iron enzyme [Planctomycetota bacterium]
MSPEQAYGKPLDPRSDLFSLGVVLYRLCTGEQPFTGPNTMAVLMALGTHNPPPVRKVNPNVPVELDRLIQRLMEKEREKRPASAEEVADALAAIEKPTNSGVPEVMYIAPIATAVENPFADIDHTDYQNPASSEPSAPASFKNKAKKASPVASAPKVRNSNTPAADADRLSGKSRRWLFVGLAGILAIVTAVIIIKITNKDGSVTELKVPDGSKVEVVDKGKTTVVVDPKPKKDPIAKVEPKKIDPVNPLPFELPTYDEKEAKKQQEEWATKLKMPVEATSKIGMKMMLIPPAGEALPKAYLLGKYEVTQGEWEKVMGYNPSSFGPQNPKVKGLDTSKFPVEQVSWYDSVEFCNKLSEKEGLKPYYELKVTKRGGKDSNQIEEAEVTILGGNGYHIPTDAEWTWGCAAGYKTKYHFGDKDEELPEYAWFVTNSEGRPHAVGEKKPNAFGLYDMHGNVWEWNEEMLTNAKTRAPERVPRGGEWSHTAGLCPVSHRSRAAPANRYNPYGLRLAQVPLSEAAVNPPPFVPPAFDEKEAKKQQEEWSVKLKVPLEA